MQLPLAVALRELDVPLIHPTHDVDMDVVDLEPVGDALPENESELQQEQVNADETELQDQVHDDSAVAERILACFPPVFPLPLIPILC